MARMVGNSGCSSPPCVVQHGSTATPPDSPELARTPAHRDSWDDGQTPSGAASSGRRGRRFKSGHPDPGHRPLPQAGRGLSLCCTAAKYGHAYEPSCLPSRLSALSVGGPGRRARSRPRSMRQVEVLSGSSMRRHPSRGTRAGTGHTAPDWTRVQRAFHQPVRHQDWHRASGGC